jgi:CRP-like cAMP-binding protein
MNADPQGGVVHLLDADPDLAERVAANQRPLLRRMLVAEPVRLSPGRWVDATERPSAALGYLILDGLIARELRVRETRSIELLGQGDIIRTWPENDRALLQEDVHWTVIEPTTIAVLDSRVAAVACRSPSLMEAIASRVSSRVRTITLQAAISNITRVDVRLHLALWLVAERWGRVRPNGVLVPFRLTHDTLAGMVGARRPSVTTALGQLQARDLVERDEDGLLVVRGAPDESLAVLAGSSNGD